MYIPSDAQAVAIAVAVVAQRDAVQRVAQAALVEAAQADGLRFLVGAKGIVGLHRHARKAIEDLLATGARRQHLLVHGSDALHLAGLALADHGDGIQRLRAQRGIGAGAGIGGGGGMGGARTLQRRAVGCRCDHHRSRQPLAAQIILDELAHFAAPFADQADHDRVAAGLFGQHGQKHRLAHAGTREDAQPLAPAGGGEDVHGPHAQVQPLADPAARMGRGRGGARP